MKHFLADKDVTLLVPFRVNQEPVVPDTNSVTFTLRGHNGSIIVGYDAYAIATGPTDTQVQIILPALVNAITERLERRSVMVDFTVSGASFNRVELYQLSSFLNHSATPSGVRALIGCNSGELSDEEIDLISAYFQLEDSVTQTTLEAAAAGSWKKSRAVDEAIMAIAALEVIPSLQLRVAASEGALSQSYARLKNIDFRMLHDVLSRKLEQALTTVSGRTETTPLIFSLTAPTDPITG